MSTEVLHPNRRPALIIVEGAIVDAETCGAASTVKFYRNETTTVWGTLFNEWAERNKSLGSGSTMIEVRAVNIADYLRLYGIPHYMKIDIEGADVLACAPYSIPAPVRLHLHRVRKTRLRKLTEEFQLLERLVTRRSWPCSKPTSKARSRRGRRSRANL